jgi:NhaP-type Na+/H+ or K+/H+ antiporter
LVKLIDKPLIETTITIVTAYGVYLLADALHTSAILAVIVASLILAAMVDMLGCLSEHEKQSIPFGV